MKKTVLSLTFALIIVCTSFSQQLERPKKQVSLVSEVVSQLNKATGWTLQNNGSWISAENKIPFKEYSLNKINKGRYALGVENFTTIEIRQIVVLEEIYSIMIIKYIDGNYEFPILEQNWTDFEALKYYVFDQNKWNKVLPPSPDFNKPFTVNMNILCSSTIEHFNEKTYLFEIENHIRKAIFQKEESLSNLIFAIFPIDIGGKKLIRFKIYETLNKKELFIKYLLSYNWEKIFKSFYYELKFEDFREFTDNILAINPKNLVDRNYYLSFLNYGIEKFKKENFITASQSFSKAIMVHPPDSGMISCFLWRGKSFFNLKLYELAMADFDSVLNRKPNTFTESANLAEAFFMRGNTHYAMYEYANACEDWHQALEKGYKEASRLIKKNCGKHGDTNLVKIDLNKSEKHFNHAMKEFEKGNYLKSLFLFESSWKYNPSHNDFRIPYYLGVCRYNTGDYVRAIDDFEKACKMKPEEDSDLNGLWLNAFVLNGKAWQNINYQSHACNIWHTAQKMGSFEASELILKYCSEVEKNIQIPEQEKQRQQTFSDAVSYYEIGNYGASVELFTKILDGSSDDESLMIYSYRASAKHKLMDYQGAIDDFTKAIEKRPENQKYFTDWLRAWFNRGVSKYFLNDFNGACSDWKQAIEMGLEDIEAQYYLNNFCGE